jgi:hypothetical protein
MPIHIGPTGQRQTPDGMVEGIVDTLPHWFFHAWRLPMHGRVLNDNEVGPRAAKAMIVMSIERSLRIIWQETLWQDWAIDEAESRITHHPGDRHLEEMWLVWTIRQQSLGMQNSFLDGVALHGPEAPDPTVEPILDCSVTAIETRPGRKRVPRVARLPKWGQRQRTHHIQWATLRDSYLRPFLEESLPNLAPHAITLKVLFKVWCVVSDLVEVMAGRLPRTVLSSHETTRQYAHPIYRDSLVSVLAQSLGEQYQVAEVT